MYRFNLSLAAILVFSSTIFSQQLLQQSFVGPISGDTVAFNIYLPAGYDTSASGYPVVYHLHGLGGTQGGNQNVSVPAVFNNALQAGLIAEQYIIVFPNGLTNSMWADSKSGLKPVETHVVEELIPYVDTHFKTLADRANRYVQGFSMGGFGAANYIAKYPQLFQSAVLFDGALHSWQTLLANRPEIAEEIYDNDEAWFNEFSSWAFFKQNAAALADSVCLRIVVGELTQYNQSFRDSLIAWGMPHEYIVTTCAHNLGCLFNQEGANSAVFQEDCHATLSATALPAFLAGWKIFPNPVAEKIFLLKHDIAENAPEPLKIRLFDTQGGLLASAGGTDFLSNGMDVSAFQPGIYFAVLHFAEGLHFQKFVKI